MIGKAKGSPATRGVADIEQRMKNRTPFEEWSEVMPLDFATTVGTDLWEKYWLELAQIEALMHEAQKTAAEISKALKLKAGV